MYPHHLDELLNEAATALTEARAEIERLRQECLVKDSAIIEAAKLAKKLMTRAVQAEQEHTDMMWQRRRAEERAEKAESALAEAVEVIERLSSFSISDELGKTGRVADLCKAWVEHKKVARTFIAEHGSDSKGE